jgi:hypothetical protein
MIEVNQVYYEKTNHRADPIWDRFYTHVICKQCHKGITGDGSKDNPWRHLAEPKESGVTT